MKNYSELIDEERFKQIKNYLKVDIDFEDDLIKEFLDSVALILIDAIDIKKKPSDFMDEPRFHLAVKNKLKKNMNIEV